jgi:hypothetical protein
MVVNSSNSNSCSSNYLWALLSIMPWKRMGKWSNCSIILILVASWRWAVLFTPQSLYSRLNEAWWAPEPVWTLWRRKNGMPV